MNKTDECINELHEHIAGMAEHAFYAALEMKDEETSLDRFMTIYMRQLEHVASEYLINRILKHKSSFQYMKKLRTMKEVQKIIDNK